MKPQFSRRSARGFTLIELITVVTLLAILAGLAMIATQSAIARSHRAKTEGQLRAIENMLARYQTENGQFPVPKSGEKGDDGVTADVGGVSYPAAGAQALYQAFTADGDSALEGGEAQSSGKLGSVEGEKVLWGDLDPSTNPQGLVKKKDDSTIFLVDAFGVPWQYKVSKFANSSAQFDPESVPDMHNKKGYDLWSYGGSGKDYMNETKWIKNW